MSLINDKIECPNCSHQFDVEEALSGRISAHYKKEFEQKVFEQSKNFNAKLEALEQERKIFQEKKEKENELFLRKLNEKLEEERLKIAKTTEDQFSSKLKLLEDKVSKKQEENLKLKQKEIAFLKKEQELKEKAEELQITIEKELISRQAEIEEQARKKERENFELEKLKLLKQIEDNKKLAEEMKRKAEQGSMQMQGEILELALEELLGRSFPFDQIEEVPKGINGADIIQTVINSAQSICGKIVFETKRTKNFDNKWIEKLKQDQIRVKADIAVLVTETMPKDLDRFDQRQGIWICTFKEAISLTKVLREILIKTDAVQLSQDNKGDKMELLYNYLTSNDFISKIKRIVENYDAMILQLNSEKKAMFKIWSQREKQIWVVQENINALFGDIKGIAGNALSSAQYLEISEPEIN